MDEVQIQLNTLVYDGENDTDMLAGIAASAAVSISDIPFITPTAHAKVGQIDGKFILFPTIEETERSDFEVVVAGTKNAVNMIEVGAYEVPEDTIADAIKFAHDAVVEICGMIEELMAKDPTEKKGGGKPVDPELLKKVKALTADKLRTVKGQPSKHDRKEFIAKVRDEAVLELAPKIDEATASYPQLLAQRGEIAKIRTAFYQVEEEVTRESILNGVRPDGRSFEDIRAISCNVGVLPRLHGSAVFSRGETQAMCTVTLGTSSDEQPVQA